MILSKDAEGAPATVTFANSYDGGGNRGYGIENHFTQSSGESGATTWTMTPRSGSGS